MSPQKRGLGRGLNALLGSDEEVRSLQLDELRPNRYQPRARFDDAGLQELADSIRVQGMVQPLVVTREADGRFTIVAGERRWRAAEMAGLERVPVVVRDGVDDRQLLELALVENLQRTDLNPLEEAEAYRTLQESFELSQEEIAERVGKSRSAISNSLRLLRLPEEVQEMLRQGRLSAGQARPLLALPEQAQQEELARRAVQSGLSAREMERLTAAPRVRRKKRRQAVETHAQAAAEELSRRLQTRVEVRRRSRGGIIAIHFHSEDELIRLYEMLTKRRGQE